VPVNQLTSTVASPDGAGPANPDWCHQRL